MTYSIIQKSQLEGAFRLDAEYFMPEYLELENKVKNSGSYKLWKNIEGRFVTGPFGSEFNVENYVTNGKYRYVRGKDVKDFFLEENDNVYLPKKDFERLSKYALAEGDILISVVGTSGNAVIVDNSIPPAIYSCKNTAFRTKKIDPYYLITFLNSKYGKKLLERSVRGAVQTGLNIDDLKSLLIFVPSNDNQEKIGLLILKSKKEIDNSKLFYQQAEDLLLEELHLSSEALAKEEGELFSIVNLSDVQSANRIDAEYFQSKYKKLVEKISSQNFKKLGELVSIKKGFEPGSEAYQETGKPFIRVSNLTKLGINEGNQQYLNDELYNRLKADFEPKVGEILLSKDATPGIAYVIKEPIEGIISGGILRLKVKNEIEAEYVSLVISSLVGKMQAERDAGGSVIAHWKPEQIKDILIPILSKPTQQKIADLIRQSHKARKESRELLEEAKRKVVEMIEKGEK